MKSQTCCFTGHRKLPLYKMQSILKRLSDEIENLYSQGMTDFVSGGAVGFDQIAASMVIAKKQMGLNIRLIFALPCKNQDEYWTNDQKTLYRSLLKEADEIIYVSNEYSKRCMKMRNYYMIEMSSYCICALLINNSGTSQTVNYAKQKGLKIINAANQ